jgi:3-isopropylmalate/(R)-2-methylmalate dehydratase small subunit
VLPIRLPAPAVLALAVASADGAALTVDLQRRLLIAPGGAESTFEVDALRREGMLLGLDDIGLTLQDDALIRAWQQADRTRRPWAWPQATVTTTPP